MRIKQFAVVVCAIIARSFAEDSNGSEHPTFKQLEAKVSKTVTLTGILYNGVQGLGLSSAFADKVSFYLIPEVPPGGFSYPKELLALVGKKVSVTGELKFRAFPKTGGQRPPGSFYMTLQQTKVIELK